jgi:hypothetical protein
MPLDDIQFKINPLPFAGPQMSSRTQFKINPLQSNTPTMNNIKSKISEFDMKPPYSLLEEIRLKTMEFSLPHMNFPLVSDFLLQKEIKVINPGIVKSLADRLFQSIPDFTVNIPQNIQWTKENKILELLLECVIFLMVNITNLSNIFPFIDLNVYSLQAFVYNRFQNDFMAIQNIVNEIFLWDETLTFLINNNCLSNFKNSLLKRNPSNLPLYSEETMKDILFKERYCKHSNCIFFLRFINTKNPSQILNMNFLMKPYNFFQVTLEVVQKIQPKIWQRTPMDK